MKKVKPRLFTMFLRLCEQQTALFVFSLILVVLYYPNGRVPIDLKSSG